MQRLHELTSTGRVGIPAQVPKPRKPRRSSSVRHHGQAVVTVRLVFSFLCRRGRRSVHTQPAQDAGYLDCAGIGRYAVQLTVKPTGSGQSNIWLRKA